MKKAKATNTCIRVFRDEQQILRCKRKIEQITMTLPSTAQFLALAGNEVRLKILLLLREEGKLCVCDLSDILGMKIPAVSQHLRKLKDAGIVFNQREGTIIYYQLSMEKKQQVNAILNLIAERVIIGNSGN